MFSIVQLPLLQQRFVVEDRTFMVTIEIVDSKALPDNVESGADADNIHGSLSTVEDGLHEQGNLNSMIEWSPVIDSSNLEGLLPQSRNGITSSTSSCGTEHDDEHNPLLADDPTEVDPLELTDNMSVISSEEFIPTSGEITELDPDDPRTILTWNSSGLSEETGRKKVWGRFMQLVETSNPVR